MSAIANIFIFMLVTFPVPEYAENKTIYAKLYRFDYQDTG
jgi:hypothetical protein